MKRTTKQVDKLAKRVKKLMDKGMLLSAASHKVGINPATISNRIRREDAPFGEYTPKPYKKRAKANGKQQPLVLVDGSGTEPVVFFKGTSEDLANLAKLAGGMHGSQDS